jgi:7,8-dihydropterin-6-yl-methyl-4-(beta-D-ribofuranosyl)aminobenzene 5'-phosphate synthase
VPALAQAVRPLSRWALAAASLFVIVAMPERTSAEVTPELRITVVYNNVPHTPGLATAWGFAAVVEAGPDTVLFDTGGDAPTLLANMTRLNLAPERARAIVLSHVHRDHTGGLDGFLARWPKVTVYMPRSFPAAFRRAVERRGARVEPVSGPRGLFGSFYSTGELGDGIKEQALIVDTAAGSAVITGCAHPGIVEITGAARAFRSREVCLLMGGFHLLGESDRRLQGTLRQLRNLGVRKVAPSHCTGGEAITLFRAAWGPDFVEGGCGAVIEVR